MSWLNTFKPNVLCLGAGGIKGLDELGAIWWFWLNGNLEKIDTYIGSSIGGIIGALMAMGWSPHHILEYAIDAELFNSFSELNVTQIINEFGLVSNNTFDDSLGKKLADMIIKKLGKIPTLSEFYEKTGKRTVFVIVSLKDEKLVYADHISHPDMNLMTALRSTSNAPVVFGKLEHQKDYLVDGAVMDPYPINYLDDGRNIILGIGVQDRREWTYTKMNAVSYYDRIVSLALKRLTSFALANMSDKCYSIIIPVGDETGLLKMGGRESRLAKFLSGYEYADKYVLRFPCRIPFSQKREEEAPLTLETLRSCFKSHAAKLIIRSMKENPAIFEECLKEHGISFPIREMPKKEEVRPAQWTVSSSNVHKEVNKIRSPRPVEKEEKNIILHSEQPEEEEDILEIPRHSSFPLPRTHSSPNFVPFAFPRMEIVVSMNMDEEFLERVYETIMGTIGLLGRGSSNFKELRKF